MRRSTETAADQAAPSEAGATAPLTDRQKTNELDYDELDYGGKILFLFKALIIWAVSFGLIMSAIYFLGSELKETLTELWSMPRSGRG